MFQCVPDLFHCLVQLPQTVWRAQTLSAGHFFPTPPALPPAFFFAAGCLPLLAGSFRLVVSELFTVTGPKKLSSRPSAGQHNVRTHPC